METEQPLPKDTSENLDNIIDVVNERLETHDDNRKAVQDRLFEVCGRMRTQIEEFEEIAGSELTDNFTTEDDRLQSVFDELMMNEPLDNPEGASKAIQKAKAELLVVQSYEVTENKYEADGINYNNALVDGNENKEEEEEDKQKYSFGFSSLLELKTERHFMLEMVDSRKPTDVRVTKISRGKVLLQFNHLSSHEMRVISDHNIWDQVKYVCLAYRKGENKEEGKEYLLRMTDKYFSFTPDFLEARTTYAIRVKAVFGAKESVFSDEAEFTTPEFNESCVWRECPDSVYENIKYFVDPRSSRIGTLTGSDFCTITGNTYLPPNTATSWNIRILKSKENNGDGIFIGVAPSDINQNEINNQLKRGWYIYCLNSTLFSGPPHNYKNKAYDSTKEVDQQAHTGSNVSVVMDTEKGELSFIVNGVNLGVAYEGIPLDVPLVPCALLYHRGDSVELITSEAKETVDSSIPTTSNNPEKSITCDSNDLREEFDSVKQILSERLEIHDSSKNAAQDKLNEVCRRIITQINGSEDKINKELEKKYTAEDARLQAALNGVRSNSLTNDDESSKVFQKAKAELLVRQSYELTEDNLDEHLENDMRTEEIRRREGKRNSALIFAHLCELKTERHFMLEMIDSRKPTDVRITKISGEKILLQFNYLNTDEMRVISDHNIWDQVKYVCLAYKKGENGKKKRIYPLEKTDKYFSFTPNFLEARTTYAVRVKAAIGWKESEFSDEAEFTTPEFNESCIWKKCPDDDDDKKRKYSVDEENPRIAIHTSSWTWCTIIGNTYLPFSAVTSWSIKIQNSKNNGYEVYIGVAPFYIDQNDENNSGKCGWYFYCFNSALCSGPPHNHDYKAYGPRKGFGGYVHTGDSVGVVMDTAKGELSFALNGVNLGVAFKGIPLDKPLVPCVLLGYEGDSIELDTSEVKERVDSSIPIPSNIITKGITWDSITLTWDAVEGASFYQIEADRSKFWDASTTNAFTRRGLLAETEHTFRVRVVRGNSVSEWSDVMKGRTQKAPDFSGCVWKECPDDISEDRKYSVDVKNPRIGSKIGSDYCKCTMIGNTPLPLNTEVSWSIKILKSEENGSGIWIGVAPSDIDQNDENNSGKCGWYFYCYSSRLCSGPPHNYRGKEYGPRKEDGGEYVHTGDSVGVVMDTVKGELSFVVNGVNFGVAFEGIPLDKPLVPCVFIRNKGNSVELDISEVKVIVNSSIPVPFNITTKSTTWDSITLTWDAVEGASFYQIEANGSKFWDASTTNTITWRGLPPETEYTFRVRAVRGNSVSKWSDVVKGRTLKESFETSFWKERPNNGLWESAYTVNVENPRIATKIGSGNYCTIIGNTPLPLSKVTSWSIKILESENDDGDGISIGVAPFYINQNERWNKCGWYFYCYYSTLWSGPPHNYNNKEYGPRKGFGEYIHTGDSVGVVMDTAKGDLSFVVNGVNLGVAYEGIPLDNPLVPCVLLYYKGDSIELDTSEVKVIVDSSIPAPSNITSKSITWDSITLTWDAVEGASFYQIEVDGSKFWDASTINTFMKRGLLAETEHTFRVRAVRGNSVSEWSDRVKGRTQKELFECGRWKECPDSVGDDGKYSVDKGNLRIATKINSGNIKNCTILWNTPIPPNKATSWGIKILNSRWNDGDCIYLGVAPFNINRNGEYNPNKCGWYFYCRNSTLCSGPPQKYSEKEYGPRNQLGERGHTGDSVDVVMDTANSELSFVLDGVNHGIAYEGIPLDRPLVPCVILYYPGDSVELVI